MSSKKILVLRFSAMGDVVLLVPVLRSLTVSYPNVEVIVATRPKFSSFFKNISRVRVFQADVDNQHKGFLGVYRLFKQIKKERIDVVVDVHDHIRSRIVCLFFLLTGVSVVRFDKGRSEKQKITRRRNKIMNVLPHTVERYHQAFTKAGFHFPIISGPYLQPEREAIQFVTHWLHDASIKKNESWVGIAPFAMHRSKIWPIENYQKVMESLLSQNRFHFFLFGGGKQELSFFQSLREIFPNTCTIVAGALKLDYEIALMKHLDLMLCVDSSNMHIATLMGVPILSVWGGTYPGVGFGPYQYSENAVIQINTDVLPCRPCSVYGKEVCYRGDFACMNTISVEWVVQRIIKTIGKS